VPEGDTVFLAATRLRAALTGQVLTRTDFRMPRIAAVDLAGRAVEDVASRGKHLLFRLGGGVTLHTHYKMEGSWHLYRPGERWRGPGWQVRVLLETAPWIAVGFRLAVAELVATAREGELLAHLGPDPLGADWDAAEALRRLLARPDRAIGDALLDQRVMAGPGNVWKNELCFLRGLDPWTPVGRVPQPERLIALVRELFEMNKTTGNQLTTGDLRPGQTHWVYGRGGRLCRRCGTSIRIRTPREPERVTYWCPSCQPVSGA
jgi:formamidopyrimidine-DNA glycosylase